MIRKFLIIFASAFITFSQAHAFDIKDILKKSDSENSDGKSSGLSALTDVVGGLLSSDKISVDDLVGSWAYSEPAVTFKSDNLLKKAGGAVASKTVTDKLAPIYKTIGFDKMTLNIEADSSFTMKVRGITLKGTISTDIPRESQANFIFNFKIVGKIKLGAMETYVIKSATGSMSVMFDISKLVALLEKVSSVANVKTIRSAVSLLKSYDGLCAGFKLKKQ